MTSDVGSVAAEKALFLVSVQGPQGCQPKRIISLNLCGNPTLNPKLRSMIIILYLTIGYCRVATKTSLIRMPRNPHQPTFSMRFSQFVMMLIEFGFYCIAEYHFFIIARVIHHPQLHVLPQPDMISDGMSNRCT